MYSHAQDQPHPVRCILTRDSFRFPKRCETEALSQAGPSCWPCRRAKPGEPARIGPLLKSTCSPPVNMLLGSRVSRRTAAHGMPCGTRTRGYRASSTKQTSLGHPSHVHTYRHTDMQAVSYICRLVCFCLATYARIVFLRLRWEGMPRAKRGSSWGRAPSTTL